MEDETYKAVDQNAPTVERHANLQMTENGASRDSEILQSAIVAGEHEVMWENEFESANVELTSLTKTGYVNICNVIHDSLESLLADEMTSKYANFSLMFKKFRQMYALNLKLQSKVFELESVKRLLENKNKDFIEVLGKRDAREKELKSSIMTVQNALAEAEKQKNDVERQRDEFEEKLHQAPEEIITAGSEYSSKTGEMNLRKTPSEEAREKTNRNLESDLEYSQKRENMFRTRYHEATSVQNSLREEIVFIRRELAIQTQMRENAKIVISEKNNQIKETLFAAKQLKKVITDLEKNLDLEKQLHNKFYKESQLLKKALKDSEIYINNLNNDLNARKFQIMVLKNGKEKLEVEIEQNKTEIHVLKVENSQILKERNHLLTRVQILEDDTEVIKKDYEEALEKIQSQTTRIENLEKEKKLIETEHKEAMKQAMKVEQEFRSTRGVIKQLQSQTKILELRYLSATKELNNRANQIEDLEKALEHSRLEKDSLNRDILNLNTSASDSEGIIKTLQQRCAEHENKILQLQKQIQIDKEEYKFLNSMHADVTNQLRNTKQKLEDTMHLNNVISQRNKNHIVQISNYQERQDKLEKKITVLKVDSKNARSAQVQQEKQCDKLADELSQKERENLVVLKCVAEKDGELSSVRRKAANLASDRVMLKAQLAETAKEIARRDDRIRILEQDLPRLEQVLQERVADVKLLKTEVESLRRTEAMLKNQNNAAEKLRFELSHVHQELLEEKLKSKTLEDELQKSQNIHRWRILEAQEPTTAHLISRNLKIQKDLVKKTDQVKITEQELQNKNRQITELQQDLRKLLEAKSGVDKWTFKKEILHYSERIKCLSGEIAMYNNLTSKQQIENKELRNEINKLKLLMFEQKLSSRKVSK